MARELSRVSRGSALAALVAWGFVALINFVTLLFVLREVPGIDYWMLLINLLSVLLGGPMAVLYGVVLFRARQLEE
ncbi:hypothetical protein CDG81_17910 [Actinopolyspora erythraea]|uniref:DUF2530 domain-containing protein n=1 Tax=Actinopolyspora erythraea TaxID=414996 RepID=A0A099D137_9ACTN|nr:hypothetical protein [Actinopolyspora erythraea]ASU79825.1 hypothetical protein CDG81_17910 [Actinopolyspora erythraea]KGI79656.1 hypothetical protein IL38_22165 [Actinopolyspora erythraea]